MPTRSSSVAVIFGDAAHDLSYENLDRAFRLVRRGAELVAIYPASIVTHGQALNITCESLAGWMNFGFTGCHSSLPSLQRLAVYAAEAMSDLHERLTLPGGGKLQRPSSSRSTG